MDSFVLFMIEMKAWECSSGGGERCIANYVAYASLHNRHLGKQQIKRSTGREEKREQNVISTH